MNGATNDRKQVQQWPCKPNASSMSWAFFDPEPIGVVIQNEKSAKCLDVTDGSLQDGARLQQYNCFDTENVAQHFIGR
jgi:hypothetical protein